VQAFRAGLNLRGSHLSGNYQPIDAEKTAIMG
jgi:hypothetical protein